MARTGGNCVYHMHCRQAVDISQESGMVTTSKFIDPLADKILVTAASVALVELQRLPAWIVVSSFKEFIVTGLRMLAAAEGEVIAASRAVKPSVSQIAIL